MDYIPLVQWYIYIYNGLHTISTMVYIYIYNGLHTISTMATGNLYSAEKINDLHWNFNGP